MPAEARATHARASERLGRLLAIVPYIVEHPGARVAEVGAVFGVGEDALVEDLSVLFLSGLPPYGPGDLIDVDLQDGRVWITMANHFSRPLRLTRNEALTLYLRGTALAGTAGVPEAPALASALAKLRTGLGPEILGEAERVEAASTDQPGDRLEVLRRSAVDRQRIEIDYVDGAGEPSTRRVDPEEVFSALGNWYVAAWDHRSDQERLFRADRIRDVRPTGEAFEPRGLEGAGRSLYTSSDRDVSIRLLLDREARWVAEYHVTDELTERGDGRLEVVLPARRLDWAARLVLRVAPHARVLDPPELKDRVRELGRATLEQYS
jgi:proteasome accessory factor C